MAGSLTDIRSEFVSCRVAGRHPSFGCQVVVMPPAVIPPEFVDMAVSSLVHDMLRSLSREHVATRRSSDRRASLIGQIVVLPTVLVVPPQLMDVTVSP